MDNTVTIVSTEFVDLTTGKKTYGYRIYDAYERDYYGVLPEPLYNPKDILILAVQYSPQFFYCKDTPYKNGVLIDGIEYNYDQIAEYL